MTKMPAPMMAPTPSEVRLIGPRMRRRRFSPAASACSVSSDFVANNCFQNMRNLLAGDPRHATFTGREDYPRPDGGEQGRPCGIGGFRAYR